MQRPRDSRASSGVRKRRISPPLLVRPPIDCAFLARFCPKSLTHVVSVPKNCLAKRANKVRYTTESSIGLETVVVASADRAVGNRATDVLLLDLKAGVYHELNETGKIVW